MQMNERQLKERVKKGPFRSRRFTASHVTSIEKRLTDIGNGRRTFRPWWTAVLSLGILGALLVIIMPQLDTMVPGGQPPLPEGTLYTMPNLGMALGQAKG